MARMHAVYTACTRLYPRRFRLAYGDDLVQHFADLVADRGARAAWARTSLDLIVTVPRYRLESIMTEQHSATTLNVVLSLLIAGGILSLLTGVYSGLALLVVAIVIAVAQRSTLARALRTPDSNRRSRRLRTAGVLAVVFALSYGAFLLLVGDTWTVRDTVLAIVGTPAMFGAIVFLLAGLLTPKGLISTAV